MDNFDFKDIDVPTLIKEVQQRPILWDVDHCDYTNNRKRAFVWQLVGDACDCTGPEARSKFRNLRQHYIRRRRQNAPGRSFDGNDLSFLEGVIGMRTRWRNHRVRNRKSSFDAAQPQRIIEVSLPPPSPVDASPKEELDDREEEWEGPEEDPADPLDRTGQDEEDRLVLLPAVTRRITHQADPADTDGHPAPEARAVREAGGSDSERPAGGADPVCVAWGQIVTAEMQRLSPERRGAFTLELMKVLGGLYGDRAS